MPDDFDDRLTDRESVDREMEDSRGGEEAGEPGVMYVVKVLSTAGEDIGAKVYRCAIVNLTNPEEEGAPLTTDFSDVEEDQLILMVTNLSGRKPLPGQTLTRAFKIGDRFVMEV